MIYTTRVIGLKKTIALVAHDKMKDALLKWANHHIEQLSKHDLIGTGTTATLLTKKIGLSVSGLYSGPMGGDQQLGALIAEQKIDILIFFWDPFGALPHDPDVKALLRLAAVWNIPVATNKSSANFIMSSPYIDKEHSIEIPDYTAYMQKRSL